MAHRRDRASCAKSVTLWQASPSYVLFVIVSLNCWLLSIDVGLAQPQQQEFCTEPTRPHPVRCEWFYRCALLPSRTLVWIIDQCRDGQVYRHGSSVPCVTPDNVGAKCKISPGSGASNSDENVVETLQYGGSSVALTTAAPKTQQEVVTDRLHGYLLPSILGDNQSGIKIMLDSKMNRTHVRSSSSSPVHASESLEDFDSSGDNELANELDSQFPEDSNAAYDKLSSGADKSNLVEQDQHSLDGIMNDEWSVLNDMNTRLPLPPDGKILPEHLSQIIEQQNQLNRIAAQVSAPSKEGPNRRPAGNTYPLISTAILSRTPTAAQYDMFDQYKFGNGQPKTPFMPDQIINSIFQISQQMIAQKPPAPTASVQQSEEPAKRRPVFIPISSSSSGIDDAANKHEESKQSSTMVAAKPIGISFVNPTNLKTTMVAHNLQNQSLNGLEPNGYHTILYDEYGNKFLAKGALKLESAAPGRPTYSEHAGPSLNLPPNVSLHPSILSSISPMLQDFTATPSYSFPPLSYNPSPQIHATVDNYSTFGSTIIVPQDNSKESLESEGDVGEDSASADVPQSDEEFTSPGNSNESGQSAADSEENVSLSQNLFSDTKPSNQQDYDQYKDSIVPLLDANPNDVRISVVTCAGSSRQPNATDCFKYFVCNPHSGAIHAFTCPSFTAFNKNTRLCDIASFKDCKASQMPDIPPATEATAMLKRTTTTKSNRVKTSELITAQKYIELMRQQSNKIQTRNKLPQQQQTLALSDGVVVKTISNTVDRNVTRSSSTKGRRKPTPAKRKNANRTRTTPTRTTTKTTTTTTTTTPATPKTTRRRKVIRKLPRCRFEGRIPDPKSRSNYYLCHRKSENKFIKVKVSCPAGLVYCSALQYCTVSSNC
ncbi:uncharacterized protein LOC118468431 [Anopheles albimanus]|uniref:uncharacterized protein LOC118468431 n=1 Tax=Anopheles albimanus TaxID=7167 RepID=UPI00163F6B8F|nr:uncharacterized protein LOC118468431 [Anopheles albimanus]